MEALYDTLRAWGVGSRGSVLVPRAEFGPRLRFVSTTLTPLEALSIDADDLDVQNSIESLSSLYGAPLSPSVLFETRRRS